MQTQIGNITKIINGYPFKSYDFNSDGKGLLIIRIQDMEKGPNNNSKYWEGKYDKNVLIKNGDILVSLSGSFKVEKWEFSEALLNQRIIKIETNNKENLLNGYLYYFLTKKLDEIKSKATNTSIPNISVNDIRDLKIPLPPISTQKQIIQKLDKLTELITLRKESIKKGEDLTKSIFIEMFGDININSKQFDLVNFSEIISINAKMIDPKKEIYSSMICIGGANIVSNTGELINLKTAKEYKVISNKFLVSPNDILFSKIRPNLKKISFPKMDCLCSADIYPLTPNLNFINNQYLKNFLLSDLFTSIVSEFAEKRAQIPKVNREELDNIIIPLPPISLQNKFAEIVQKNEENIKKQKESLEKLEELYNGIMQESFRI